MVDLELVKRQEELRRQHLERKAQIEEMKRLRDILDSRIKEAEELDNMGDVLLNAVDVVIKYSKD